MQRSANCRLKLDRMNQALGHREPDRVPISDFFWGSFLKRWRRDLGLTGGADIYRYYDLDWQVVNPNKGMLFSPAFWRKNFKPGVKALVEECHSRGLPVIYHGCGNVSRIFEDFIEIGVDAYNPLEFKAGLDAIDLRRKYGHRIGLCGNMDVQLWASGSREELRSAVITKLNAAKGGGFIFQSDHSVPPNVPGESYDYVVRLVRRHGVYPLRLGERDLPDVR